VCSKFTGWWVAAIDATGATELAIVDKGNLATSFPLSLTPSLEDKNCYVENTLKITFLC
jgi:hypothetical protein